MKRYVLAITGASGPALGVRVLEELAVRHETHLVMSPDALEILYEETGTDWRAPSPKETLTRIKQTIKSDNLYFYDNTQMGAPVASGSFVTEGMAVVPCSMKTLSGIASGYAENLVQRAADVTIKEGRRLVICPREMPLSAIHLENMLKLSRLGVRVAPPVPAFYHGPRDIQDMMDFMAGKVLDALGVEHELYRRWVGRKD